MVRPSPGRRPAPGAEVSPPVESRVRPYRENYQDDENSVAHARNFLDCAKSRQRPIVDIETEFYSTLTALLALLAIQQGRSFT